MSLVNAQGVPWKSWAAHSNSFRDFPNLPEPAELHRNLRNLWTRLLDEILAVRSTTKHIHPNIFGKIMDHLDLAANRGILATRSRVWILAWNEKNALLTRRVHLVSLMKNLEEK